MMCDKVSVMSMFHCCGLRMVSTCDVNTPIGEAVDFLSSKGLFT